MQDLDQIFSSHVGNDLVHLALSRIMAFLLYISDVLLHGSNILSKIITFSFLDLCINSS